MFSMSILKKAWDSALKLSIG
jgi:uncharacterized damage-inducible protein DinB